MRSATLVFVLALGCGEAPKKPKPVFPLPMKLDQCVETMLTDPPLQARFVIPELDITCPLTVTLSEDKRAIETSGFCENVPLNMVAGDKTKLILEWYVVSPKVKKEIIIAEQQAQLEVTQDEIDSPTFTATFFPDKFPVFSKASPLQTAADKDRFNCDRHGQLGASETPCDSTKPVTQSIGDKDNCSNLEELCKGTLFQGTDDVTCTGM